MTVYTARDQAVHRGWFIEALRSGEYDQGKGQLCRFSQAYHGGDGRRFWCCLGVGCDVAIKRGNLAYAWDGPFLVETDSEPNTPEYHDLPPEFIMRDFYGFASIDGHLLRTIGDAGELVGCNDTLGLSFAEIADLIEQGKVALVPRD